MTPASSRGSALCRLIPKTERSPQTCGLFWQLFSGLDSAILTLEMSALNPAEVAANAIDAWNRQDLEGFLDVWHPDCEWRPAFPKGTEGSGMVFRGRDAIADAWHGVREAWEKYQLDVEDARMVDETLLVLGHIYLRGIESGVELDSPWSAIVRLRDGMILSAWDWLDHASPLEALGLPAQDVQA
jgi:ketosteroid isomerase-like protein